MLNSVIESIVLWRKFENVLVVAIVGLSCYHMFEFLSALYKDVCRVWCLSMPPWCWPEVSVISFGTRLYLHGLQAHQGRSWLIAELLPSCWWTLLHLALPMLRHPVDGNQLLLLRVLETSLFLPGHFRQLAEKCPTSIQHLQLVHYHHRRFWQLFLHCHHIASRHCWTHFVHKHQWHSPTAGRFDFCHWYFFSFLWRLGY